MPIVCKYKKVNNDRTKLVVTNLKILTSFSENFINIKAGVYMGFIVDAKTDTIAIVYT